MKPFQLGVTGGIGSGKSVVCSVLAAMGIPVFNADASSKKILETDDAVVLSVKELLGPRSYSSSGKADRKYIASVVFNDVQKLNQLNSILHPAVQRHYISWVEKNKKHEIVAKEAAIMFESGSNIGMDAIAAVIAPAELRIHRVMQRDNKSSDEVLKIISRQMDETLIVQKSNFIIHNDDHQLVVPQIIRILNTIKPNFT